MSTAGRPAPESDAAPSDVAATLRDASFVRIVARADGPSLAATGLLARALSTTGTPYQARLARPDVLADRASSVDGDGTTVVVGGTVPSADRSIVATPSVTAHAVARELGHSPDPLLALAGVAAGGRRPGIGDDAAILESTEAIERRPGVGVPTADLVDGLAHTTLAHAAFSGDKGAVQAELAELGLPVELDEHAHRTVASLFALTVAGPDDASPRAVEAVERVLRPHATPNGRFATIEGYGDVLSALAWDAPGTGIALALGNDARTAALDAWREHARAAHAALAGATTGRYDGVFVARTDDAPVETVARLLRDFRSPEPVALVVTDDEAAAASTDDCALGDAVATAAPTVDGTGGGSARRGYARFDGDAEAFVAAFREAL